MKSASLDDLPGIAEIYAHYVENSTATFELEPPGEAEWNRRFSAIVDAGLPFLVAETSGKLAGYAYCGPWKTRPAYRRTVEDSIYLAPWAVGQGLGGLLFRELLTRSAAAGLREMIAVIVDNGNESASAALHRRHGFTEAGRLTNVGFKHGQWLDTLLMQRSLTPEGL
ncbi:GNAT family N-acetyltransferase [Amycolatopsis rhizosphaerae]|uniref:GNAT family N-acetyltransferase n=1 Tax=Amycolatopsis rhizosphaerae TaxID=2053003 RepID=UPI001FEB42EF|nr:GNAT family N-acetyltransferase [Amycolatopsis rhizosphaerae]